MRPPQVLFVGLLALLGASSAPVAATDEAKMLTADSSPSEYVVIIDDKPSPAKYLVNGRPIDDEHVRPAAVAEDAKPAAVADDPKPAAEPEDSREPAAAAQAITTLEATNTSMMTPATNVTADTGNVTTEQVTASGCFPAHAQVCHASIAWPPHVACVCLSLPPPRSSGLSGDH